MSYLNDLSDSRPHDAPAGAELLTPADVAELLHITPREVWLMVHAGELPRPARYGRRLALWPAAKVQAWIVRRGSAMGPAVTETTAPLPADLVGLDEAAELADVHQADVLRWLAAGRLRAWQGDNGALAIRRADVLALAGRECSAAG